MSLLVAQSNRQPLTLEASGPAVLPAGVYETGVHKLEAAKVAA